MVYFLYLCNQIRVKKKDMKKEMNDFDLWDIVKIGLMFLGLFCKKVLVFLISLVKNILKYKYITLAFCIVAIIFAYYRSANKLYEGGITFDVYSIDSEYNVKLVENLDEYVRNKKYDIIAEKLEIPLNVASSLKSVKAYHYVNNYGEEDIEFVDFKNKYRGDSVHVWSKNIFYIDILVNNDTCFESLNKGFYTFFLNNTKTKKYYDLKLRQITDNIKVVEKQITDVENIKRKVYEKKDETTSPLYIKNNQIRFNNNEVQLFYDDIIKLNREKYSLEKEYGMMISPIKETIPMKIILEPVNSFFDIFLNFFCFLLVFEMIILFIYDLRRKENK